jgi:carbon-monoxide dehydrogenase large subunit
MDPLELRRRNLIPDDAYPASGPSNIKFQGALASRLPRRLDTMMNYAGLRAEADSPARARRSSRRRFRVVH